MSVLFSHTMRGIRSYSPRYINFAKGLALLVLVVWGYWFFFSRINVYEISRQGKLVLSSGPFPVEPAVSGPLLKNHLILGGRVKAGQVLAELDTTLAQLELEEIAAELKLLRGQVTTLDQEIQDLNRLDELLAEKERLVHQAELSQIDRAKLQARLAERERTLTRELFERGMVGEMDIMRAESQLGGSEAELNLRRIDAARSDREGEVGAQERRARIMARRRLQQEKRDRIDVLRARERVTSHRVAQGVIRAEASGVVAAVEDLAPGAYLTAGRRIATILPGGELHVVAWFPSARSLGKIFPGQEAVVKLDGFPWTRYGGLRARVTVVGSEPSEGLIRVELDLNPVDAGRNYLQHGLPGAVEIVVDQLSPAGLLLQMLGKELREEPQP